ncbi:DUF4190 domain-containing protein [Streptomyces sp. NPDC091278]|uniref:DUF4190 domain-containing protein n=1 Tax=Streptomyces sp. NPDC091278 TaxID=3155301 RepID=UPI00344BCDA2
MTTPTHTPGPPAWGPPPPFQAPPARTALGVGALVVGIVGLVFAIVPFLFWLGGIMGVVALVLGIVGLGRAKRGETNDRAQSVAGIVLGSVSLLVSAVWLVVIALAVNTIEDEGGILQIEASETPGGASAAPGSATKPTPEPEPTGPAVLAFGKTHTYDDGVKVTVSAPRHYRPDAFAAGYEKGQTAVQFTITIVNGGDRALNVASALPTAKDAKGTEAGAIFDGSRATEMFRGTVLPGKRATSDFTFALPAGADKEIQVELEPEMLRYDTVIWSGPVK